MLIDWDWIVKQLKDKNISGWFSSATGGHCLQEFQTKFAHFCDLKHGIAVSGGSASIYVALRACEVGPGDYVAVPAYTHIGSVALSIVEEDGVATNTWDCSDSESPNAPANDFRLYGCFGE